VSEVIQDDTLILFEMLLGRVHKFTGHDFSGYKLGTLMRRVEGRLRAVGAGTVGDYIEFIEAHTEEYQRLIDYLTIAVSDFLRSHYTFQQVAGLVLPELLSRKLENGERSLRFWSAASARGQEAYSIAIVLADFLKDRLGDFDISIYATDINSQGLALAEAGVYSIEDVKNLSPDVIERHFNRCGEKYVVNGDIRRMVSFSHFDLLSTAAPPFVSLDCIFCCNILIYLKKMAQEQLVAMLLDYLNARGYLILGEAETLPGNLTYRFDSVDVRARIYRKNV